MGATQWLPPPFVLLFKASSPSLCKSVENIKKWCYITFTVMKKGFRTKKLLSVLFTDEQGLGCECDIGVDTVLSRVATFAYNL